MEQLCRERRHEREGAQLMRKKQIIKDSKDILVSSADFSSSRDAP